MTLAPGIDLCVTGGTDHLFALGVTKDGWTYRVPNTETNDWRSATALMRDAGRRLKSLPMNEESA